MYLKQLEETTYRNTENSLKFSKFGNKGIRKKDRGREERRPWGWYVLSGCPKTPRRVKISKKKKGLEVVLELTG